MAICISRSSPLNSSDFTIFGPYPVTLPTTTRSVLATRRTVGGGAIISALALAAAIIVTRQAAPARISFLECIIKAPQLETESGNTSTGTNGAHAECRGRGIKLRRD